MKKSKWILAVFAAVLVLTLSIGSAVAYFTDNVDSTGAAPVIAGPSSYIDEEPELDGNLGQKTVTIYNRDDSVDVYFRAKVFSVLECTIGGEGWTDGGDGFWYYGEIVAPGGSTEPLLVEFELPENAEDGDNINVIVIYEATPVIYDRTPDHDWSLEGIPGGNS